MIIVMEPLGDSICIFAQTKHVVFLAKVDNLFLWVGNCAHTLPVYQVVRVETFFTCAIPTPMMSLVNVPGGYQLAPNVLDHEMVGDLRSASKGKFLARERIIQTESAR